MQEQCGYDCEPKDNVQEQCIRVGNEWVDRQTRGATWEVDDFTADGYPIGFRWLVPQDVRRLYADFKQMGEYTCNAKARLTQQEFQDLQKSYNKRAKKISNIMSERFPKAHALAMRRSMEAADRVTEEQHAMKASNMETMVTDIVKAVAERMGQYQGVSAVNTLLDNAASQDDERQKKRTIEQAKETSKKVAQLGNLFQHKQIYF